MIAYTTNESTARYHDARRDRARANGTWWSAGDVHEWRIRHRHYRDEVFIRPEREGVERVGFQREGRDTMKAPYA